MRHFTHEDEESKLIFKNGGQIAFTVSHDGLTCISPTSHVFNGITPGSVIWLEEEEQIVEFNERHDGVYMVRRRSI